MYLPPPLVNHHANLDTSLILMSLRSNQARFFCSFNRSKYSSVDKTSISSTYSSRSPFFRYSKEKKMGLPSSATKFNRALFASSSVVSGICSLAWLIPAKMHCFKSSSKSANFSRMFRSKRRSRVGLFLTLWVERNDMSFWFNRYYYD